MNHDKPHPVLTDDPGDASALKDALEKSHGEPLLCAAARHCDEAQGYLFSRPVSAENFSALMAEGLPALLMSS